MTFTISDGLVTRVPNSRAALASAQLIADSQIWEQLLPLGLSNTSTDAYFTTLLKDPDCTKAWEDYTNTTAPDGFPYQLARGTVPLNGFRHYNIQDVMYLEYYVRMRLEAIGTAGDTVSLDEIQKFAESVKSGLEYAASTRSYCTDTLGVPSTTVKDEPKSAELTTSIDYYTKVAKGALDGGTTNAWVDIYFALLPCIRGYYEIAAKLIQDPKVVKNTQFYSWWIEGNANPSYADGYNKFLETATAGVPDPSDNWTRWREIFKTTCKNEQNFFQLAINNYSQYDIVESGSHYTISPYGDDTQFLDVKDNVVTVTTDPAKWALTNNADGYTIEHQTTQKYLTVSTEVQDLPYYNVQADATSQQWDINSVTKAATRPRATSKLFAPCKLAFVLDWNVNVANSKVFVANNYSGTSQSWIIKPVA